MTIKAGIISALAGSGITWFGVKAVCAIPVYITEAAFRLFVYAGAGEASDHNELIASCENSNPAKVAIALGAVAAVLAYNALSSPSEKQTPQLQS